MSDRLYLLLPLLAAGLYALAAMGLKAASVRGFSTNGITVLANWVIGIAFLVFVPWTDPAPWPPVWWAPAALALTFFSGQLFTVLALSRGDVSVATPLLGSKSVLVAFFLATFFRQGVGWKVWLAAIATVAGIALLQRSGGKSQTRHAAITVLYSLLAAGSFGLFDVLTQELSKQFGYGRVVPAGLLLGAILSLALLRPTGGRWKMATGVDWTFMAIGVLLMALQSLVLITTIGKIGDAAGCNIVYGSRGLWSILLVWLVGHWFGNRELHAQGKLLVARLIGAGLVLLGVILVFTR